MDIYLIAAIVATATYMFVIRGLLDNIFPAWRYWIGLEDELPYLTEQDFISLECDHHPALTLSDCNGCY